MRIREEITRLNPEVRGGDGVRGDASRIHVSRCDLASVQIGDLSVSHRCITDFRGVNLPIGNHRRLDETVCDDELVRGHRPCLNLVTGDCSCLNLPSGNSPRSNLSCSDRVGADLVRKNRPIHNQRRVGSTHQIHIPDRCRSSGLILLKRKPD